jgi:hypothetical protein
MAAQQRFPALIAGAWVSICEQVATRQSLIVSMIGGAVVLGTTQSAPDVVSADGEVPAGIFLQGGDVSGPGIIRLSSAIDADLVTQEWFAWLVPGSGTVPYTFGYGLLLTGGVPQTIQIPIDAGQLVVVAMMSLDSASSTNTCDSLINGPITAFATHALNDGSGVVGVMALFAWVSLGGLDIITLTAGGALNGCAVYYVTEGIAVDVTGTTTAVGSTISVVTSAPVTAANEVVALAQFGWCIPADVGNNYTLSGIFDNGVYQTTSQGVPSGNEWLIVLGLGLQQVVAPVATILTFNGIFSGSFLQLTAFTSGASSSPGCVVSVFESWEPAIPPEPPKSFAVTLPRLNPDALELLRALQQKVEAGTVVTAAE